MAEAVNVLGTEGLLSGLDEDWRFVYLFTDLVFDGARGNYREEDETNPINRYALVKRQAEVFGFDR